VVASERRRHLANVIAIAKAFANSINVTPFQVRSQVIQKLGQISKICSVQKLDIVPVSESVVIC